jgi:hypothetical protein
LAGLGSTTIEPLGSLILATRGELKLYGMKAALDQIVAVTCPP